MNTSSKLTPIVRIVDDNEEVLRSESFLVKMAGWEVRTYNSAVDFLNNDDLLHPGCMILDIRMPNMSGMQLQEEVKNRKIDLPVIFLSGHGDIDMAVKALLTGAIEFISKPPEPHRLKAAIEKAIQKNIEFRQRQEELVTYQKQYDHLTSSEKNIAIYVASGLVNKVIANQLGISEQAVKNARVSIFHKLELTNPVALNNFLRNLGLIKDRS